MTRDKKILAAAKKLFFERGFSAVGVDEIGVHAGITGPAIYRHFTGKDEILSTLFDQAVDALVTGLRNDIEDPDEELRHLTQAHALFALDCPELATMMIRDKRALTEPYKRRYTRRERPYIERWISCLERCYPERSRDEVTTATFAVLAMLNSIGTWPRDARMADDIAGITAGMALGALFTLGESRQSCAGFHEMASRSR
jgi:AcrR family transcriptional regulator